MATNAEIPKSDAVLKLIRNGRTYLIATGKFPHACVTWRGEEMNVMVPMGAPGNHDDMAELFGMIRRTVVQLEADTVLYMCQGWGKELNGGPPSHDDFGGKNIQDLRGSFRIVILHLESNDGAWTAVVPVVEVPGQPPLIPMPKYWALNSMRGVIENLLPDKKA